MAKWAAVLRNQVVIANAAALSTPALKQIVRDQVVGFRDTAIRAGEASEYWTTYVDGQQGADERQVRLNGGSISYVFSYVARAAQDALDFLQSRSPVRSGDFRRGWIVMVNDVIYTGSLAKIQPGSIVTIVNNLPYSRKIDTGGMRTSVAPQIVESARQFMKRQYPALTTERTFITLEGGSDARGDPLPYILRGGSTESGLSFKKGKWTRKHAPRKSRRSDRQAGSRMTYPALIFKEGF